MLWQIMWATCVYIEAVSVFPQLRMMQNAKVRPGCLRGAGVWPAQQHLRLLLMQLHAVRGLLAIF